MLIFSIFANIFCLCGCIGTFVAIFSNIGNNYDLPKFEPFSNVLLFLTSIMYAYEGIPAVKYYFINFLNF